MRTRAPRRASAQSSGWDALTPGLLPWARRPSLGPPEPHQNGDPARRSARSPAAGSQESMAVGGVSGSPVYFATRTLDMAGNVSAPSNGAR